MWAGVGGGGGRGESSVHMAYGWVDRQIAVFTEEQVADGQIAVFTEEQMG